MSISKAEQLKSFNRLANIAKENGGRLLETGWLGCNKPHRFVDASGYEFKRSPGTMTDNGWPKDKRRLLTPEEKIQGLVEVSARFGYQVLDGKWAGRTAMIRFKAPDGKVVSHPARFFLNRKRTGWTPQERKNPEEYLETIRKACLKRGGKLISKRWVGSEHLYKIEDENGIPHQMSGSHLKSGRWLRSSGLTSEPLCRQAMEHLFGKKFPKDTSVLRKELTLGTRNWELDGYCREINVAFEYQGYSGHWDPTSPSYKTISARDKKKRAICRKLGVVLVNIPRLPENKNKWKPDFVLNHVLQSAKLSFKKFGRTLPATDTTPYQQDMTTISHPMLMRREMANLAKKSGGSFLDKEWRGSSQQHLFAFPDGRTFWIAPHNLKRVGWPQDASSYLIRYQATAEDRIRKLRDNAAQRGYRLIETSWAGSKHTYNFVDSDGVDFKAPYGTLRLGFWPKQGETKEARLEKLRRLGKTHGCKLVNKEWQGLAHSYSFLRPSGSSFQITAASLGRSGWPKKEIDGIKFMTKLRHVARKNGCSLLDLDWKSATHRYKFKRKDGAILKILGSMILYCHWPRNESNFLVSNLVP